MATKNGFFKVILLLLFVCNLFLESCSLNAEEERDYKNWLSWNLQDYKKKTGLEARSAAKLCGESKGGGGVGGGVFDDKLKKAETNKVRIIVSQDGTGDFMTIGEALNSIPKPNSKRVILDINSGIYRYIGLI